MKLPYKTSVITDEIAQDLAIAIDVAKEYGLDGVEIRGVWGKGPHELTDEEVARVKDMAGQARLAVCAVAPPFFKCDLEDPQQVSNHLGILKRSCAVAKSLDTRLVRGFAFWRRGPLEDVKDQVVGHLKEAARIVESEGMILALENEYDTCNNNVRRTLELIEAVASDALRLLFDPGNDVHDPEREKPWPDAYRMAQGRFVHMHLKDPKRDPATGQVTTLPIGEGDINAPAILGALVRDGYTGFVSLETHYRREPLSHEVARLPKGESFSAGGYVASRECLDKWFAIAANVANARPSPAV